MLDFFRALFGETEGWVPIVTYPKSERRSGKPWADWDLTNSEWFQWPQQADAMVAHCHKHRKEDVYTLAGVCSEKRRTKKAIREINAIWCDADTANPSLFAAEPSLKTETSPGRYQLFWRLDRPMEPEKAEQLAKAIAYSQRVNGADTGWNMNKVIRVPGTTNTKPTYRNPKVTFIDSGHIYTAKKLRKLFGSVAQNDNTNLGRRFPRELPELATVLRKMPNNPELVEMYSERPRVTPWNPEASRYKVLFRLACFLFRAKFTAEEVYILCANSQSNKYAQDGRNPEELWRDVLKAEVDVASGRNFVFVDEDEKGNPIATVLDLEPQITLLQPKERELIERTWIDDYVEWAETQVPNADRQYHVANGMTVLASTLSQFGYALPQFGPLGLELWFMVLGVTTLSRKTSAASQMLKLVRALSKDRDFEYILPDDNSPEALQKTLAERGEVPGLFHVDEAQGLITSERGGKGYMSGTSRLLTQLYDGWVPAANRIGREGNKASRTHLTMNLLGVPGKMTAALTREDFASGFLARFIFVLGQPKSIETLEDWKIRQGDPEVKPGSDETMTALAFDLTKALRYWEEFGDNNTPIMFTDDAWDRWNRVSWDLLQHAKNSGDPESVIPTAQRTAFSIMKLSCLLAMAERSHKVHMKHLVSAISYGERWYDTMVIMSGLVHQNQWARQVAEVIEFIKPGHTKSYAEVSRRFNGIKPREFQEIIDSAVRQGRVVIKTKQGRTGVMEYLEAL